jgi:hypothetical protein
MVTDAEISWIGTEEFSWLGGRARGRRTGWRRPRNFITPSFSIASFTGQTRRPIGHGQLDLASSIREEVETPFQAAFTVQRVVGHEGKAETAEEEGEGTA